jgi:amino acid transporter
MLPYGHFFTICKLGEPVWGIILSMIVALLVGLVQFGPAAAFNSLTGSATVFLFLAYALPCLCMLFGGRQRLNRLVPERLHNLGRWGIVCNIVAVFFVVQALVIYSFPAGLVSASHALEWFVAHIQPVTADNMNYGKYLPYGVRTS